MNNNSKDNDNKNMVAFVDLDGPVADGSEIEAEANKSFPPKSREWWKHITGPVGMKRRKLVESVADDLHQLELAGYDIIFLTSRLKDELEEVTRDWLEKHEILVETGKDTDVNGLPALERPLVMKPASMQYVKGGTPLWKACAVCAIIWANPYSHVLVVEDDAENKIAISDSLKATVDAGITIKELKFASSLAEALGRKPVGKAQDEEQTEVDEIPF